MLSALGCRQRRLRLWDRLDPRPDGDLFLTDPIHLAYLAGFTVDPFSLGGGFGGLLQLRPDGFSRLLHDDRLPDSAQDCHVDEHVVVPWYDAQSAARGPRQLALLSQVDPAWQGFRCQDRIGDPNAVALVRTLAGMRRQKDADELDLLRYSIRCGEAGHAWARQHIRAGMTEMDVYVGVAGACQQAAGRAVLVYGDFAVSPGSDRKGGPPTARVLEPGDMFILDFSVVIDGYRGDFTNTLVVSKPPTADQQRLYDLCTAAMAAGEKELRAGTPSGTVYAAVRDVFSRAGVADAFPHHAGHGLGLTHPEAPYFVAASDPAEVLLAGDVVTLEPGLYITGIGGIRIEHNYHITHSGYERLSHHTIGLK
jgi:Xaa-Pro dipeptidase